MTYNDMLRIAMEQSAEDLGCKADDFTKTCNVIVPYNLGKNARKYLKLPITANLVSYGNNVVAGVTDDVKDIVALPILKAISGLNEDFSFMNSDKVFCSHQAYLQRQ